MIHLDLLIDDIASEIDRLSEGPKVKDLARFEVVLQEQFRATQAAVHTITGSLKRSGKIESSYDNDSWQGEISYGGVSTGVNNPVEYAQFERERDDTHDFMRPIERLSNQYVAAIEAFLKG